MFSSVPSFVWPILSDPHVICAAAGAFTMWAVMRWSTFMGWYAANSATISTATGVKLPTKLPTTVAEMKAAAAAAAPAAPSIIADVEAAPKRWLGDIVADVKKL